jgi:hypothetical protein
MEYEVIEKLNKSHVSVKRGDLMIPILKLNLFDNDKAMNPDYTIGALEGNVKESKTWKQWLQQNNRSFGRISATIYTAKHAFCCSCNIVEYYTRQKRGSHRLKSLIGSVKQDSRLISKY